MKPQRLLVGTSILALAAAGAAAYVAPLAADPAGPKDCATVLPPLPQERPRAAA
ncbi:hypothetical protein HKX06_15365, partial [Sphingomonas paucimobilis]|nr:hypothetical protein [Sphingomonas paucimobilis]